MRGGTRAKTQKLRFFSISPHNHQRLYALEPTKLAFSHSWHKAQAQAPLRHGCLGLRADAVKKRGLDPFWRLGARLGRISRRGAMADPPLLLAERLIGESLGVFRQIGPQTSLWPRFAQQRSHTRHFQAVIMYARNTRARWALKITNIAKDLLPKSLICSLQPRPKGRFR